MNETIRASLAKRFRVSYAILLVACACLFGHKYVDLPPTLFGMESGDLVDGIGGVLLAMGAIAGLRIKCPKCKKRLDRAVGGSLAIPAIAGTVNNCPYCGVSFDERMPSAGPIT
jgi:hypothetical protein